MVALTEDLQIAVGELLMGPGTDYRPLDFNPFVKTARADQGGPRAWNHGSWSGAEFANSVTIPLRLLVQPAARTNAAWLAAHQQLAAAFAPVGATAGDVELRWRLAGAEYLMRGRPRMVEPSIEHIADGLGYAFTLCAFEAQNPFIFSGVEHVTGPVPLPQPAGGLLMPGTQRVLNGNPGFELDTTGWFASGGSLVRSTAQAHTGVASGLLTPDGVTATVEAGVTNSAAPPVTVGRAYRASMWVYSPDGYNPVLVAISWLDAGNVILSTSLGPATAVPAGVWTLLTVTGTAPASTAKASPRVRMTGTPAATDDLHIDDLRLVDPIVYGGGLLVPFHVGGTLVGGQVDLVNAGTTETGLLLRIDGPVFEPFVTLKRPDGLIQTLRWFGLELAAGQFLEVDTQARGAFLQGNQANSRPPGHVDWPMLPQGTSTLRFGAAEFTAGTLTSRHRDAWW